MEEIKSIRGTLMGCLSGPDGRKWLEVLKTNPRAITALGFIAGGSELNMNGGHFETRKSNHLSKDEIECATKQLLPPNSESKDMDDFCI